MNKKLQGYLSSLMGTGNAMVRCSPTSVHVHKRDTIGMKAIKSLVAINVAVKTGTRCEGDVLVFESAYKHFEGGDKQKKDDGLDDGPYTSMSYLY